MKIEWTEERRKAQAERCRQQKPWLNSTGPKTPEGKARACMNAYKNGGDLRFKTLVRTLLEANTIFTSASLELAKFELIKTQLKQRPRPPPKGNPDKTN